MIIVIIINFYLLLIRSRYWLSVGATPTVAVYKLLGLVSRLLLLDIHVSHNNHVICYVCSLVYFLSTLVSTLKHLGHVLS